MRKRNTESPTSGKHSRKKGAKVISIHRRRARQSDDEIAMPDKERRKERTHEIIFAIKERRRVAKVIEAVVADLLGAEAVEGFAKFAAALADLVVEHHKPHLREIRILLQRQGRDLPEHKPSPD